MVLLSVLVGIGLFELCVRLLGIDYDLSPNWKYHRVLGWSQVPNASYHTVVEGRRVHVSFNAAGFRDGSHAIAKPPGVKRIVVIGDSFCEAVQVNLQETFHRRLEALLAVDGERWEVINLGVGDFGTAQELIVLTEYGLAFDPDLVIHQIFPLNDVCNNSLALYGVCRSENDRYRPYFVERAGGLVKTYAQPLRTLLRRHVVSYGVAEHALLEFFGDSEPEAPGGDDPDRRSRREALGLVGLDPLLYTYVDASQLPPAVAAGWRITERLVERIVAVSREHGAAYLAMVAPFAVRLDPERWKQFSRPQPPPPMDRRQPERRLARHFEALGVPYVMLLDAFEPHLDEVLPYIDGHLSAAGHRRTAEALLRTMRDAGLAP
jgi:hypothetical protein